LSVPLHLRTPAGLGDQVGYGMLQFVLEDLAGAAAAHPAEVLKFLGAVDSVPAAQPAGLGRLMLEQLEAGDQVKPGDFELNEVAPEPVGVTVGVPLSRRTDRVRDWDTRMVALVGPINPDALQIWQRVWPGIRAPRPSGPAADGAT
jgi:hypothetical protein